MKSSHLRVVLCVFLAVALHPGCFYGQQPQSKQIPVHLDSLQILRDSIVHMQHTKRAISTREQAAVSRLAQIQYYVTICDKRPANRTFFFGWVKRALK